MTTQRLHGRDRTDRSLSLRRAGLSLYPDEGSGFSVRAPPFSRKKKKRELRKRCARSCQAHAQWLRAALAAEPRLSACAWAGALPKDARVAVEERHLGLKPPPSSVTPPPDADHRGDGAGDGETRRIAALARLVEGSLDLDALLTLARSATAAAPPPPPLPPPPRPPTAAPEEEGGAAPVRIGVFQDAAFCFYYEDNLRLLRDAGATLVRVSPLADGRSAWAAGGAHPRATVTLLFVMRVTAERPCATHTARRISPRLLSDLGGLLRRRRR